MADFVSRIKGLFIIQAWTTVCWYWWFQQQLFWFGLLISTHWDHQLIWQWTWTKSCSFSFFLFQAALPLKQLTLVSDARILYKTEIWSKILDPCLETTTLQLCPPTLPFAPQFPPQMQKFLQPFSNCWEEKMIPGSVLVFYLGTRRGNFMWSK